MNLRILYLPYVLMLIPSHFPTCGCINMIPILFMFSLFLVPPTILMNNPIATVLLLTGINSLKCLMNALTEQIRVTYVRLLWQMYKLLMNKLPFFWLQFDEGIQL